jgi:protein-tyrosine sulfotransferase
MNTGFVAPGQIRASDANAQSSPHVPSRRIRNKRLQLPRGTNIEGPVGPEVGFALIVGAARSGTTLLRLLLDSHPEIAVPAEAGVPSLIAHLAQVWWTIGAWRAGAGVSSAREASATGLADEPPNSPAMPARFGSGAELPPHVRSAIRSAAAAPMLDYCMRSGTKLYCDKSLDSVHHLALVKTLFPDLRCVMLFRHVMDVVASGLEASPWGFEAYGYLPFVQRTPDNFVVALVNYWLSHVDAALAWEKTNPDSCHRVRYEDLVTAPKSTLSPLLCFLGVESDAQLLDSAFMAPHEPTGPGDHKVIWTAGVHSSSMGRGKRVPVSMIPSELLEAVNTKLVLLGYDELTAAWNSEPRLTGSPASASMEERLTELMGAVRAGLDGGHREVGSFAIVAEDHDELRWVVDPQKGVAERGDGDVDSAFIGRAEDLAALVAEDENVGVLLRTGRVRHIVGQHVSTAEATALVVGVLSVLRAGQTRRRADGNPER